MSEPSSSPFVRPRPNPAPIALLATGLSARPPGRPRNTKRGCPGRTVRIASDVYLKARPLARRCHMPLSKYLSALLRPLIEEDARALIASQTASEASSLQTVFTHECTTHPLLPL
jgi:hypothetical protein